MFKLVKSVNGRINTSEPRFITLTTAITAAQAGVAGTSQQKKDIVNAGDVVIISAGTLSKVTNTTTKKPTHVVWKKPESGDTTVWVIDIAPDMVFECPLTTAASSGIAAYTETYVAVNADTGIQGVNGATVEAATGGASQVIGAIVYDTVPANAAEGDLVRVFFKGL